MNQLRYPREAFMQDPRFSKTEEPARSGYLDIIDVVFFASTMVDEGEYVPLSVVVDPGDLEEQVDGDPMLRNEERELAWSVTRFHPPIELTPKRLKKLARATEYGRDQVVIEKSPSGLLIAGVARRNRFTDGGQALRVAAPRSGVLVLEGLNRFLLQYEAGALTRDVFDVVGRDGPVREALTKCGASDAFAVSELLRLARSTGCGALLLFLRHNTDPETVSGIECRLAKPDIISLALGMAPSWSKRIAAAIGPEDDANAEQRGLEREVELEDQHSREALARGLEQVARLSAMDGAVLINPGFEVLCAGYVVPTGTGASPSVAKATSLDATSTTRFEGGGARHEAGIRFAHQHAGAVVFVISADGPVTCITQLPSGLTAWSVHVPET